MLRPYRCDGKTRAKSPVTVIDLDFLHIFLQHLVHEEGKILDLENLIRLFWLVQSQSKGRTASPARRHVDTQGVVHVVLLHVVFYHLYGFVRYFQHNFLLLQGFVNIAIFSLLSRSFWKKITIFADFQKGRVTKIKEFFHYKESLLTFQDKKIKTNY